MHRGLLIVFLSAAFAFQCFAEDTPQLKKVFPVLKTTDGVELRDVKVTTFDQAGVVLSHSDGIGRFEWSRIPKADQIAMGFDADKFAAQLNAAMETAQRKAAQQQQSLTELRAKRIPEIKASVATGRLSLSRLAEVLKEAQALSGMSFFETAKVIFGPPRFEDKDSSGTIVGYLARCQSFSFYDICYNPNTERTERFDLKLYINGAISLEPQSGDGVLIKDTGFLIK